MNKRKFLALGLLSLSMVVVGCSNQEVQTENKETTQAQQTQEVEETTSPEAAAQETSKTKSAEPAVASETTGDIPVAPEEPVQDQNKEVEEQIQTLAGLVGKTAHDVNLVLGQPSSSKNIENTKALMVNYYKIDFCGEIAKVEVVFDPDSQVVNYISFIVLLADNIDTTKQVLGDALTNLYGESTIERFVDVKGKQKRDWKNDTLVFDLAYYENNISLDIYPQDK